MTTDLAQETRSVTTEVFAVGTWTDAAGRTASWDMADLREIIANFEAGKAANGVPLKVGHTNDAFNKRVADALDVPEELVRGGVDGNGQMRLGHITELTLEGGKLIAKFEEVPTKLAELIESGGYTSVSSELAEDEDGNWILTAVALLGAEAPAIDDLAPLSEAAIHQIGSKGSWWTFNAQGEQPAGDGRPSKQWWDSCMAVASSFPDIGGDPAAFCGSVYFNGEPMPRESFDSPEAMIASALQIQKAMAEKGMKTDNAKPGKKSLVGSVIDKLRGMTRELGLEDGALDEALIARLSEKESDMQGTKEFRINEADLPALYDALGLSEEATIDEVLAAIQAMKDAMGEGDAEEHPDEDEEMEGLRMSTAPEIVQLKADVDSLKSENAQLRREKLVAKYQKRVDAWHAVATEENLAVELADIHDQAGAEVAEKVAAQYDATNTTNEEVTRRVGTARKETPRDTTPIAFEEAVKAHAEKHDLSFEKALVVVRQEQPEAFREYRARMNQELQEEVGA